jgi:hypothetical protein
VLFSDDFERLNNQPQAFVSSQRGSHYTYQVAFPEVVESSLDSCRELELRVFRRALYLDCIDYLLATYGPNWNSMEQKKGRYRLNKLGRDIEGVRNILWHASETSFFEYHAGSRLHFFRWPTKYKSMARDGVPIMFEKAGPSKKQ